MKAIRALILLKKNGLVHPEMRLSHLKVFRRLEGDRTWEEFVRRLMLYAYLGNWVDLSRPIRIPEAGFAIGGTQRIEARRAGTRDDGEPIWAWEDKGVP